MKNTFLTLKISLVVLTFLMLTSCGDRFYSLDFSSMEFPEIRQETVGPDAELDQELKMYKEKSKEEVRAFTNKEVFHLGEEVVLTIENQSPSTVYFYPSDEEVKKLESLSTNKSLYLKKLVSKNPGIKGELLFHDPRLIFFVLEGANSLESSKYDIDGLDDPLGPGEKMVFNVKMPERPGRYLITFIRFSHNQQESAFGANLFVYSNIFEVAN